MLTRRKFILTGGAFMLTGGPLLDSKGLLIGVNTAIYTKTGFSSGIGFAIPVDTVKRIVPQLVAFGRVSLPSLNASIASVKVAASLEVRGSEGGQEVVRRGSRGGQ
jgi:S1-C subfamily serine protease